MTHLFGFGSGPLLDSYEVLFLAGLEETPIQLISFRLTRASIKIILASFTKIFVVTVAEGIIWMWPTWITRRAESLAEKILSKVLLMEGRVISYLGDKKLEIERLSIPIRERNAFCHPCRTWAWNLFTEIWPVKVVFAHQAWPKLPCTSDGEVRVGPEKFFILGIGAWMMTFAKKPARFRVSVSWRLTIKAIIRWTAH